MKTVQIEQESWRQWQTPRWKTAITRRKVGNQEQYSMPMAKAIEAGVFDRQHTLFDFGCGRGGDLRRLQSEGFNADGFDPYWSPRNSVTGANDLSLLYVLNVIEDEAERDELLQTAFNLCDRHLLVAVRINNQNPHEEVTSKSTFQRYYADDELQTILETLLGRAAKVRRLSSGVFVAAHRPRLYAVLGGAGTIARSVPTKPIESHQLDLGLRLVA